jgi:multimeric flavodoxin WrbA
VLAALQVEGIQTELVQLGGSVVHGRKACFRCVATRDGRCVQDDDPVNACISKMVGADGTILGSPTYFADITLELKALIDRAGFVTRVSGGLLRRKAGGASSPSGGPGRSTPSAASITSSSSTRWSCHGPSYWNLGIGREKDEVESDEEGVRTVTVLGENMAWLLRRLG